MSKDLRKQLKTVYNKAPDEVKRRAWAVSGWSGTWFRVVACGTQDVSPDSILTAIQALKQSFHDHHKDYTKVYQKALKELEKIESQWKA